MSAPRPLVFALIEDARDLGLLAIASPLGEVVAVHACAEADAARGNEALLAAGQHGASRAVRISDVVLTGVDYLAVAHVLACAVRHLCEGRPDALVIVLSGDRGRGAVGPAVAERLAVPHLGSVRQIELKEDRLVVDRLCGAELRRYAGVPPIVLACSLPSKLAADDAAKAPLSIEVLTLDTLQITAPELQYRRRFRPAEGGVPRPRPHLVSSVETLGDRLVRDGLWPVPSRKDEGEA